MYKFLVRRECSDSAQNQKCENACVACADCKRGTRTWSDCWKQCDECNRCAAAAHRNDSYSDPYYYENPWYQRTLATTPLSKQFCDNVCGVNMCRAYRERYEGYMQCKRCEQQSKCWSQYQNKCVECPPHTSPGRCEQKWGGHNLKGAQFGYTPPIDPMYTDCKPCWNDSKYTT